MTKFSCSKILYGGDYNPEQWSESVWAEDITLMQRAGVNAVSLGIFSWAKLEPRRGHYTFDWLEKIYDLLTKNNIGVFLATATAAPPAWLCREHPEMLPVDANGIRFHHGSRQHYCPNSTAYREASAGIARQLAQRFSHRPGLLGWHINNEYGCHVSSCYCDRCAAEFRRWLQARYKTLDVLNAAWGTAFWSQAYGDWEEIIPPRKTPAYNNPAQVLDYKNFMSDSILGVYRNEVSAVHAVNPNVPVTTNLMGFFLSLDYFKWAKELDVCAWDSYPDPNEGLDATIWTAACHDLMRSLRGGQPFLLMEQATTQVNWRSFNALKPPGMMRAQSYQAVAHGADAVMFFQWRASRSGAEKYHSALVPHYGVDGSRVYGEVEQLGNELKKLSALTNGRTPTRAAIIASWPTGWAIDFPSKPAEINYSAMLQGYHRAFWEAKIPVDFVSPDNNFAGYDLIVAPTLYVLTATQAEALRQAVQLGATLVTTYFSGIVNEHDQVQLGGYPALLQDVLGLKVEEWQTYPPGKTNSIQFADASPEVACTHWCDILHTTTARIVASYGSDFFAGSPAVTRNSFGQGEAWYIGTQPDRAWLTDFIRERCVAQDIKPLVKGPLPIEASLRVNEHGKFLFVLNHDEKPNEVDLNGHQGNDLLTGEMQQGLITIEPYGVRIIRLG
jgi:beta-galactosidase